MSNIGRRMLCGQHSSTASGVNASFALGRRGVKLLATGEPKSFTFGEERSVCGIKDILVEWNMFRRRHMP